jgi:hypothetical protein
MPVDYLAGGNCAVRQEEYVATGGFDPGLSMMHDRDLALRLLQRGVRLSYVDEMVIQHRHFKGVAAYLVMTARSGRYRRRLEERWPEIGGWRLREAFMSSRSLDEDLGVRAVAICSEMLHGFGYCFERYVRRIAK